MKRSIIKVTSLLCAVAMLISMASMFALAVGNPAIDYGNNRTLTNDRDKLGTDISVMTYNILDNNVTESGSDGYGNNVYASRLNGVVQTILAYDADLVGIQEAGTTNDGNWPANLKSSALSDTYGFLVLQEQGIGVTAQTIRHGLIILYRKDRFTLTASGGGNLGATSSSTSISDDSRWYHYAKLTDTKHGNQQLYFFNTHFSIDQDDNATAGAELRTIQAAAFSNKIHELAKDLPFFATGDYNCSLDQSYAKYTTDAQCQLAKMSKGDKAYIQSALVSADLTVGSNGLAPIDHVFVNNNYLHVRKLTNIWEGVNGKVASDHTPFVAYCNYRANLVKITTGKYDKNTATHTDSSAAATYTYGIDAANFDYQITDTKTGTAYTKNTAAVNLNGSLNTFRIDLLIKNTATVYDSIASTISYSGAARPVLQAENAVNHYFANNAYQVVVDKDTTNVVLSVQNGFVSDKNGNKISGRITPAAGRSTYYIKSTSGDFFPVYIYKETKEAYKGAKIFYLDDDIGAAVGTVAFWDGKDVMLVNGQVNAFDALLDVRTSVNSVAAMAEGYTIYMAPGYYKGLAENSNNAFWKSATILGANHNTPANITGTTADWKNNPNRVEETVVDGSIYFQLWDKGMTTTYVTVKGIKFVGAAAYGAVRVQDSREAAYGPDDLTIQLDIQNNIFEGHGIYSGYAFIFANVYSANNGNWYAPSKKSGIIAGNRFASTNSQKGFTYNNGSSNQQLANNVTYGQTAIFSRNNKDLVIDSNYFVNLHAPLNLTTELFDKSQIAGGYADYVVQNNRFDNCGTCTNVVSTLSEGSRMNIRYLDNLFIRCGQSSTAALNLALADQSATTGNHFDGARLTIVGNRFLECLYSIRIHRWHKTIIGDSATMTGDLSQLKVNMNQNVFYNPYEKVVSGVTDVNRFKDSNTATVRLDFAVSAADFNSGSLKGNWNLNYNYFFSNRLKEEVGEPVVYNPSYYINNTHSYDSGRAASFATSEESAVFGTYYTYYGGNTLGGVTHQQFATGDIKVNGTSPTITDAGSPENVTINVAYDGQPHSLTVTAPADAVVSYTTDPNDTPHEEAVFSSISPTYTAPGLYPVRYRVQKAGYLITYGYAYLNITSSNHPLANATIADKTVTYSVGTLHSPNTLEGLTAEDKVTYQVGDAIYDTMPTFSAAGTYNVTIKVKRGDYNELVKTAKLVINKADLELNLQGFAGPYDGELHGITHNEMPSDVTVEYKVDDYAWTPNLPSYRIPTAKPYVVQVRATSPNYNGVEGTTTIAITPGIIDGISLNAPTATVTGLPQSPLSVTGTKAGDVISYSVDGREWTTTVPTFTYAGTYQVAVKVSRTYYNDWMQITTVTLTENNASALNYFDLDIAAKLVQNTGNEKYTFVWTPQLAATNDGEAILQEGSITIDHYGIKYASSMDELMQYRLRASISATDNNTTALLKANGGSVVEYQYKYGVNNTLYKGFQYSVRNTKPMRARYAMAYIRYTVDGITYEEFSAIDCATSILDDGIIGNLDVDTETSGDALV